MSQHHDGGKKKSSGVGKTLAGNIRGRTVDSLKNGDLVTHVTRRGETETTNETGRQVRKNITVKVGHDHDVLLVRGGVSNETETGGVNKLGRKLDIGVFSSELIGGGKEETIRDLHDRSLVDDENFGLANGLGVLKGISKDTLRGGLGNELDGLDDTGDNDVLDTRVLTLGVLTNQNGVNILVGGLVADNGLARSDVGKEVESSSEGKVEGDVTLTNGSGERALEGNEVLLDRVDSVLRDGGLTVDKNRGNIDRFPLNGDLCGSVDFFDSGGDFDTDTITFNQSDSVVALDYVY